MTLNIQHGNGAVVVVRGPWIDKDSRKIRKRIITPTWRRTAVYHSILKRGRMCETLREPVKVLKSLSEQAINKQYKFKRLYRNLYNPEFYFLAYKNISQSQGSMTSGVDGKSLDGMSEKRISALIESIRSFSYQPNPAR